MTMKRAKPRVGTCAFIFWIIAAGLLSPLSLAEEPGSGIVINEFFANAEGPNAGFQWVEIYNASGDDVDLAEWSIWRALNGTTQNWSSRYIVPADITLPSGMFLVIGDEFSPATLLLKSGTSLGLGIAGTTGNGVRLQDAFGNIIDTVIYGPNNDHQFLDDTGNVATSLGPQPGEGQSIARISDGVDTDQSGDDFILLDSPTPGEPNRLPEIFDDRFEQNLNP